MQSTERWLPVVGYEDLYLVSSEGRIYSNASARVLAGFLGRSGDNRIYRTYSLCRGGVREKRHGHHLVLEAFVGPRPDGMLSRHIDDDGLNNALSNLAWGTKSENMLDRVRNGRDANANKTHCPHGHPYAGENLKLRPNGRRACRTCIRLGVAKYKAKRRGTTL